jgi:hypothetical protein
MRVSRGQARTPLGAALDLIEEQNTLGCAPAALDPLSESQ